MNIVLMKFGGTSVAGTEKISNIAKIVQSELKNNKLIVVLSAMAGETDRLINLSKLFISYYKTLFSSDINLNVVDLIEYDTPVEEESIYFKKTKTLNIICLKIKLAF